MIAKSRKRDDNVYSAGEGVEVETQYMRGRRSGPTTNSLDIVESSVTVTPIESLNSTELTNDFNNITRSNSTNNQNNVHENSTSDMILTILGPILLIVLYVCGHRANVPSSQYHRGAMIRRQAERVWEIQSAKNEREAIPIETRKSQISESLCKMKVVSKCAETGHCILGPIEEEERNTENNTVDEDENEKSGTTDEERSTKTDDLEHSEEQLQESTKETDSVNDATSAESEDEMPTQPSFCTDMVVTSSQSCTTCGVDCTESPGRYERKPLLSPDSEDSEEDFGAMKETTNEYSQSLSTTNTNNITTYDGFDDDEDVCPICLDNFAVGDIVMFSRHNIGSCAHVFHEECLMQWLLEQRENECPTCRSRFIADQETDSATSSSSSVTAGSDENSISELDEVNGTLVEADVISDIEKGNGNTTGNINNKDDYIEGGDCIADLDKTGDTEHKHSDEDENDLLEMDMTDEMKGRFKFMIVKGSVKRVPV